MITKSLIQVAVGVVLRQQQVILALRPQHVEQGGLWEFPGGKIKTNEIAYQGLCRELLEEIGIVVVTASPLPIVLHEYSDYQVSLQPWIVSSFQGEASGCEGQQILWVPLTKITSYAMPEANLEIIKYLDATASQLKF